MQCLLFFVHNLWRNYDFFSCIYIVFPLAFSVLFFKWNFWNLWKICGHGFEMLWLLWQQQMDPSAGFLKRAGCVVGEGNEKDYLSGIVFPWALQLASVDWNVGRVNEGIQDTVKENWNVYEPKGEAFSQGEVVRQTRSQLSRSGTGQCVGPVHLPLRFLSRTTEGSSALSHLKGKRQISC